MIIDLTSEEGLGNHQPTPVNTFPYELKQIKKNRKAIEEIFHSLQEIVIGSRYPVTCEWNYNEEESSRRPILNFQSLLHRERQYRFVLSFPMDFPKVPPSIQPLDLLPAISYLTIRHHPILCTKYWTEGQSLHDIFHLVMLHLERTFATTVDAGSSSSVSPADVVPSVLNLDKPKNKSITGMLQSLLFGTTGSKDKSAGNNLHLLISELYGLYKDDIKGYALLDQVILSLIPENFCIFLGATTSSVTTIGKGIGYTGGGGGGGGGNYSGVVRKKTRHEEVIEQIDRIFPKQILDVPSAEWVIQSPLTDILQLIIKQFSKEEISRHSDYVGTLYHILHRCDLTLLTIATAKKEENENSLAVLSEQRIQQVQNQITSCYARLLDPVIHGIFPAKTAWLKDVMKSTLFPPAIADVATTEGAAKEEGKSIISSKKQRVFHLANLETIHYFAKSTSSYVKCPKAWMKELNFIEENLTEELTLFVSEDHPNYLIACMQIMNVDSPYYGGSYLFHILISADYPKSSPKVQFMTTGGGTVRFNPNLYNCGKVCLSLLGTWAGEPWSPTNSNLTQVLKSILFLIFTEEPFYNEPGYQYTQRLAPQSLHYNYAVMQSNLKFAILAHFESLTSAGSSAGVKEIQQYIQEYYHEHWHSSILPNLTKQLTTIYKPLSNFKNTLDAITAFIPQKENSNILENSSSSSSSSSAVDNQTTSADSMIVDLTEQRPSKRQKKDKTSHKETTPQIISL